MIKKTTVLNERRIVRMREDPHFGISQDKPADQIILKIAFERSTERFFRQASPCFARNVIHLEPPFHFLF